MPRSSPRVLAHRATMRAEQRLRAGWRDAYLERILGGASRLRPKGAAEAAIRAAWRAGWDAAAEAMGRDTIDLMMVRSAAQFRWGRAHADPSCELCHGYGIEGGEPCSCAGELPPELREPDRKELLLPGPREEQALPRGTAMSRRVSDGSTGAEFLEAAREALGGGLELREGMGFCVGCGCRDCTCEPSGTDPF